MLYILVAIVATGALPFDSSTAEAPLATRSRRRRLRLGGTVLSFGALVAITSVVLTILYGQTRILFAMCRDGLMPSASRLRAPGTRTPI